jgi:ATP-dependent exoDNAse (exonuclease V) beta subunit
VVAEVQRALDVLRELHYRRNRRPIPETLSRLLAATRAHAGLAFWSGGEQALANVLHLSELARRFEARGATSFRGFVERLWDEAEDGEAEEARVVEEGTEGVRLMTVHRAKGLEFPVVLLADPTARAINAQPSRHVDIARRLWAEPLAGCVPWDLLDHKAEATERDREEAHRLAYVAATRARDLLVVPGVGDGPRSGWLEVLNPVITPRPWTHRSPSPAPGCPPFGKESVLDRPDDARINFETAVSPGLHVPEVGEHQVTWWDPAALALLKETDATLRRQEILSEDPGGAVSRASAEGHATWERARSERLAAASRPLLQVFPVRAVPASEAPERLFPVEISTAPRANRPGGRRFGALVHGVLSRAPLDAGTAALEPLIGWYARLFGCPEPERRAAAVAVLAALEHPVMARARAAAELRREAPVALRVSPGELAEGALDLAFRDAGGWTVVELKTDLPQDLPSAYHRQLALYVEAVSQATGAPASGVILLV